MDRVCAKEAHFNQFILVDGYCCMRDRRLMYKKWIGCAKTTPAPTMFLSTTSAFGILALLACQATAAPVAEEAIKIPLSKRYVNRRDDGQADLSWVSATTKQVASKYHATLTAFEDNTGQALPGTSTKAERHALRKRQSEGLTDEQGGSFWQGSISIGSPAQQFNM